MVLICEYLFKSYSLYQLPKSTVELRVEQVDFNYNITTSFKVPNQSVCQPVEPPTSATMPVETCLGKDASVVCSASMNSTPSYYQRCNYADRSYNTFTCSIRSRSHEPTAEWLAPDVLHGSEKGLTGYNGVDEEMCFLSLKKDEKNPRWF